MSIMYSFGYGDVPKWLKGPHSKCGRSGNRREGSNPSISVLKKKSCAQLFFIYRKVNHQSVAKKTRRIYNNHIVWTTFMNALPKKLMKRSLPYE